MQHFKLGKIGTADQKNVAARDSKGSFELVSANCADLNSAARIQTFLKEYLDNPSIHDFTLEIDKLMVYMNCTEVL